MHQGPRIHAAMNACLTVRLSRDITAGPHQQVHNRFSPPPHPPKKPSFHFLLIHLKGKESGQEGREGGQAG